VDPITENAPPTEPNLPIPRLDPKSYDESLGKDLSPKPVPPPINPDYPVYGGPTPPPPPPPPAPAPAAANPEVAPPQGTAGELKPAENKVAPTPAKVNVAAPAAAVDPALAAFATQPIARQPHAPIVEVMALSHESDADAMIAALQRQGYQPTVNHTQQDSLLHINVGPFANKSDAERMRERLLHDGYDAIIH
jgi:DedD protein